MVKLDPNDRLIGWKKPTQRPKGCTQEEFDVLPATMILRYVRLTASACRHRTQNISLVTTLLDPVAYPLQQLGELYLQRWSVELHFRKIKITLSMDMLHCQTPDMVEKEVMMHAVSYNPVRSLMQEAAIRHQVNLTRMSFKGIVDTLRHWSASLEAMRGMPRKQQLQLDKMFEVIADDLVPHRPEREESRAKKRRLENYHLLTKPRHKMKISGHRNLPKSTLSWCHSALTPLTSFHLLQELFSYFLILNFKNGGFMVFVFLLTYSYGRDFAISSRLSYHTCNRLNVSTLSGAICAACL